MSRDQVDRIAINLIQAPSITKEETYLPFMVIRIERSMGEVQSIPGNHQSITIDVDTNRVPSKQLALDCGGPASNHLVEYQFSRLSISEDQVARKVRRPVPAIVARVRRPVSPIRE